MRALGLVLLLGAAASDMAAQELARRVTATKNGVVRLSFAAKDGVCAMQAGVSGYAVQGNRYVEVPGGDEWTNGCSGEHVHVALSLLDGRVIDVRTYVGGKWRRPKDGTVDLGQVAAPEAAAYLIDLATDLDRNIAGSAYNPALLADSVELWPYWLTAADDRRKTADARVWAISMLHAAPNSYAVPVLIRILQREEDERQVRKSALRALAERKEHNGMQVLMDVVRKTQEPTIRLLAVQLLSPYKGPEVQAFLAEVALTQYR